MEREAKDPTRHLLKSPPLVFEAGELGEGICNFNVFIARWFIVLPGDSLGPPDPKGHLGHPP